MARWSYSQLSMYRKCPQRYKWERVDRRPVVFDKRNAYIGIVLQRVVELFYAERWWATPETVHARMLHMVPTVGWQTTAKEKIAWRRGEEERWLQIAAETVPKILAVIKSERLLGRVNLVEYGVEAQIGRDVIMGRADLIIQGEGGLVVVDGKGGGSFGKYVDPNQLRLYALGLKQDPRFRALPHHVGFWWYRFGRIVWRPISERRLDRFVVTVQETIARVRRGDWQPSPGGHCSFCDFRRECQAGRAWLFSHLPPFTEGTPGVSGTVSL